MEVNATLRENVKVDISEYEISELIRNGKYAEITTLLHGARRSWIAKVGYTGHIYIKDGKWFEDWEDAGYSHSWTETEEKSKATEAEQAIWDHFVALERALRAYE